MTPTSRPWPAGRGPAPGDGIEAVCEGCGAVWRVHENLAGFRFACEDCGGWVTVPQPVQPTELQIQASRALAAGTGDLASAEIEPVSRPVGAMPRDDEGLVRIDVPEGVMYRGEVPVDTALAAGALVNSTETARRRWTNRTALEITFMMLAILGPQVVAMLALSDEGATVLMPVTSLIGGVLVIVVGLLSPHYSFGAFRGARPRFFAEALVVAAAFIGLAIGWMALLEKQLGVGEETMISDLHSLLGTPLTLMVVAAAPAIFEEVAFRGLLQGRLEALLGRAPGLFSTAALFALAHGLGYGTPLHVTIGVYLGLLRVRSGSLVPGMLLHLVYNGTLVLHEVL